MAILSREHGFLFIQTPRTGCTALAEGVLMPELGGVLFPDHDVVLGNGAIADRKHVTLRELLDHQVLAPEEVTGLLTFTTVRNPFDRLVSAYEGRREKASTGHRPWVAGRPGAAADVDAALSGSFAAWVEQRLTSRGPRTLWRRRPVGPRHMTARYLDGVDEVLRFESMQADFDRVLERLGIDVRPRIPVRNATAGRGGRDYRGYYDEPTRDLVATVYSPDLERFGYEF